MLYPLSYEGPAVSERPVSRNRTGATVPPAAGAGRGIALEWRPQTVAMMKIMLPRKASWPST